ncbi:hypothetical protein [Cernens ardua]|uniref:hypothetical protein n=1 Tax=Cernens ardua TaxID=3402176 RepID=UPI003F99C222
MSYQNKSTNALIWDKQRRFQALIKASMPTRAFSQNLLESFGGPPDPVLIRENRYVSASACEAHECTEKSFYWYDTKTGIAVGATLGDWQYHVHQNSFDHPTLVVASNTATSLQLPEKSIFQIRTWLQQYRAIPAKVSFINRKGQMEKLPIALFLNNGIYQPSSKGPSFDCTQAYGRIDEAICHSPALSQQDYDIYQLAQQIRNGTDEEKAREQLAQLLRNELAQREHDCYNASQLDECLLHAYKIQKDTLMNWTPH